MQKGLNIMSHPASDSGYRSATTPDVQLPRSVFNRSHTHKTTLDMDYLVPFYCEEVYPGDTHAMTTAIAGRMLAPLHQPIMDNMYLSTFFFFVPMRLVWDNSEKFFGERDNPDDSIDYMIPTVQIPQNGVQPGTLWDYFGMPLNPDHPMRVNALPFRAHNLIYNDWFRDQNMIDSVNVPTGDGPDASNTYNMHKRRKVRDYFTACLPQPQKGDAVEISISGGIVPVEGIGIRTTNNSAPSTTNDIDVYESYSASEETTYQYASTSTGGTSSDEIIFRRSNFRNSEDVYPPRVSVNLDSITAITINQLRQAFQVQRLLERDARGGTRYIEILRSHFNVVSPDARLQRPEYLGGGKMRVDFSTVAATAGSPRAGIPDNYHLGDLGAFASISGGAGGFSTSFVEHGYIIGYVNLTADLTYQQGLHKMWNRKSRLDFMWPALAGIGEQAVHQGEIYWTGVEADDSRVFGYIPRFEELRTKPSMITGRIRSNTTASLDLWHVAQDFANAPTLSKEFVEYDTPLNRVKAVDEANVPDYVLDIWCKLTSARVLPTYGVPGHIDSF
jgi:hypothetical protein